MSTLPEPRWLDLNADEEPGVEVRVKQGMALLDEKHGPGWVWRIDVDGLCMADPCRCVLGQLYACPTTTPPTYIGAYTRGSDALFEGRAEPEFDHGFLPGAHGGRWDHLTTAWCLAILARRAEAVL